MHVWRAGALPGTSSGKATWLIVGRDTAAPTGPVDYDVGGTLRYTVAGLGAGSVQEVALIPVRVTVYPVPQLHAHYFLERNVISDNPFTPEVCRDHGNEEPAFCTYWSFIC